jgi:hypothetical protein
MDPSTAGRENLGFEDLRNGKQVTMSGIDILRISDGKIVEMWNQEDVLGMMQQLGAIPEPGQSEEASPT